MARKPRIILPGHPAHIIQRGNNRSASFYTDNDYLYYLHTMHEACLRYRCKLHAYVLMTNHVHLLMTAEADTGISLFMQSVGRYYVRYINKTYKRTGTLWEGRFKSSLVQDGDYYFNCSRYIELNPVRARMVEHPGDYRWSSYRYNAQGQADRLIVPHLLYHDLGDTRQVRAERYRELFNTDIDPAMLDTIRVTTNKNKVLGNDRFREEVGRMLQRRLDDYKHGGDRKSERFRQEKG